MGTISIAALLRFEMPPEWVAVGWSAMAVVLYFASGALRKETFRAQCYAMTLLAGVRCGFDNFYRVNPWRFTNARTVTVTACALMLYVLFAAAKLAKREPEPKDEGEMEKRKSGEAGLRYAWRLIEAYPQHLFFFVPTILLTILVTLEVRRGFLTAAWGIEGLIVFLAGVEDGRAGVSMVQPVAVHAVRGANRDGGRVELRCAGADRVVLGAGCGAAWREFPVCATSGAVEESALIRWVVLAVLLLAGCAAAIGLQQAHAIAPISPRPLLYLVADAEGECGRCP